MAGNSEVGHINLGAGRPVRQDLVRINEAIENKTLKIHHFGVKEFLKRKMEPEFSAEIINKGSESEEIILEKPSEKLSFEENKELKRRKNQLNNQVNKFEELISKLESKIKEMDILIAALDYSNEVESSRLLLEYQKIKEDLDSAMLNWEKATEELMEMD